MKIILDTNVLISGVFFSGPPYQILKSWQDGKIQIVLSKNIITEYKRVAAELSKQYPSVDIKHIIELLTIHGEIVETKGCEVAVCDDPNDDMFISCALAGKSKTIVSGDKHLLKISGYRDIVVFKPRDFLDKHLR